MPRTACDLPPAERAFLQHLRALALRYFLDNQTPDGLVLDRQRNFAPRRGRGWRSTAATGMGLIALALSSAEPARLLSRADAVARVRRALTAALANLPHVEGILPHFLDDSGAPVGSDRCSTIDSAWLLGGGLWAAAFLQDAELTDLAQRLFDRVDWGFWTDPSDARRGLLRHGMDGEGRFLPCAWDRLNGETVFLYVLAAGAASRPWPAGEWPRLRPFFGSAAGLRFASADLGLFVFQYGLDLLDLTAWREPGGLDLVAESALATEANAQLCQSAAGQFATYRRYWGLSAGDGPGDPPDRDTYRCYAPGHPLDGTAHLTATLASIAHRPALVLENLLRALRDSRLSVLGRYGFSNLNLDRNWVGRDLVGIDAGAAVLALDNFLAAGRIRQVFHTLPDVARGLTRIGFQPSPLADLAALPRAS
jgi:hypothetical protein